MVIFCYLAKISKYEYLVSGDLGYSIYTKRNNKPFFNISNVKGAKLKNEEYTVPLNSSIYIQLKPIDYITNPNKFSYRYRDSSNYEWIYFRTNSEIEYNCKNSDVSQLEIQYIDRDGNISDSEFVNLNILKPWYIRFEIVVPLYGSIFILLITTIYAFYIYFKKRKHVDFLKEKEIIRQREELEKARAFQINMLPENSPSFFNFDIATHISTADEVGGDYYDFFEIEKKNELVAVLGDATGHGMIAGNVVSITKAGLNSVNFNKQINQVLQNINQILKKVGIGRNRMCLNICHLNEHSFEICSAGMPPTYIYKKSDNSINELIISGLPAGSLYKNKYESKNFTFDNGDVIVMLSDGLPECENVNGEILGYDRVKETILSSVDKNAEKIKDDLINLGKNWLNDIKTKDDITFMIIKKS